MQNDKTLNMNINDVHTVRLESRGSAGLKLSFRYSDPGIVEITRLENGTVIPEEIGGPIPAVFEIKALQTGNTTVEFFETRPWDKSYPEILQKSMVIKVL